MKMELGLAPRVCAPSAHPQHVSSMPALVIPAWSHLCSSPFFLSDHCPQLLAVLPLDTPRF